MDRKLIGSLLVKRFEELGILNLAREYKNSGNLKYLVIDKLLPASLAESLYNSFPTDNQLRLLNGPQERKYIGLEFTDKQSILEECLYSFQEPCVIEAISCICGIQDLEGDPELYAGGISSMSNSCFLNPHIDNSHDRLKLRYRRLNLLYYISKDWQPHNGGQLLLYPDGISRKPIEIDSIYNRLVIMKTDKQSFHGVKKVTSSMERRLTISNYYFSKTSPTGSKYYHSTSFRGFKGEKGKDLVLRISSSLRTMIKSASGNVIGKIINTGHYRPSIEKKTN
jgi:Rps23 Pro-64 3,4-dihydroxylase Tpa1-like proline 4-hydroxylase